MFVISLKPPLRTLGEAWNLKNLINFIMAYSNSGPFSKFRFQFSSSYFKEEVSLKENI